MILNKLAAIYTNRIDNCPVSTSKTSKTSNTSKKRSSETSFKPWFQLESLLLH